MGLAAVSPVTLDSGRGMRNRWPSGETAKVCQWVGWPEAPRLPYPESNKGRGAVDSIAVPVALIPTETIFPRDSVSMKKSSLPSRRQRGKFPPFVETCHLPAPAGNG